MAAMTKEEVIRLECVKIAWATASRVQIEKDACLEAAEKIYKYVTGDKAKAPSDTTG